MTELQQPLRVMIVDDDALVRTLLATILQAHHMEVVAEAADGDEVVEVVRRHRPDVILMDIRMARMSGIAATAALQELPYPPGVVMLTSFDTEAAIIDAVSAGAVGFLAKDAAPEEIISAVQHVAAGEGALSARAARVMVNQVQTSPVHQHHHAAAQLLGRLTARERDVVAGLVRGLSNSQIAAALHVGESTVKSHLVAAQSKTGTTNRVQLAVVAAQGGLTG